MSVMVLLLPIVWASADRRGGPRPGSNPMTGRIGGVAGRRGQGRRGPSSTAVRRARASAPRSPRTLSRPCIDCSLRARAAPSRSSPSGVGAGEHHDGRVGGRTRVRRARRARRGARAMTPKGRWRHAPTARPRPRRRLGRPRRSPATHASRRATTRSVGVAAWSSAIPPCSSGAAHPAKVSGRCDGCWPPAHVALGDGASPARRFLQRLPTVAVPRGIAASPHLLEAAALHLGARSTPPRGADRRARRRSWRRAASDCVRRCARVAYAGLGGAGGLDADVVIDAGAALELLHTFALVHDDVMDGSETRRGVDAVHRSVSAPRTTSAAGTARHAASVRAWRSSSVTSRTCSPTCCSATRRSAGALAVGRAAPRAVHRSVARPGRRGRGARSNFRTGRNASLSTSRRSTPSSGRCTSALRWPVGPTSPCGRVVDRRPSARPGVPAPRRRSSACSVTRSSPASRSATTCARASPHRCSRWRTSVPLECRAAPVSLADGRHARPGRARDQGDPRSAGRHRRGRRGRDRDRTARRRGAHGGRLPRRSTPVRRRCSPSWPATSRGAITSGARS